MAFRAAAAAGTGSDNTPTVSKPAGAATNDIALIFVTADVSGITCTTPTGFTAFTSNGQASPDGQGHFGFWKRLDGSEGSSFSGGLSQTSDWIAVCAVWSGRDTGNPPVATLTTPNTSSNASPVSVALTGLTASSNDDVAWFGALDSTASGTAWTFAPPSSYTEATDTANGWAAASLAYRDNVSSGATGTLTGTATGASGSAGFAGYVVRIPAASGGGGPTLTDLDSDEVVTDGQTGATITGTNLGATTGDRTITLEQGAVAVTQTQTAGDATSGAFTVVMEPGGAALKFGSVTAKVTITAGGATATIAGTVNPASGHTYIDVGTPNSTAGNRITASADIASGDQLHARGAGGGSIPTGLTLDTDATFYFTSGNTPASFDVRVWDSSDQTWGSWAEQSVGFQPSAVTGIDFGAVSRRSNRRISRGLTWMLDAKEWWG